MKTRSCLWFVLALFAGVSDASEREALQSLYDALGGYQWNHNDSWGSDAPLSEWYGVSTHNGRVLEIDLAGNGLIGQLPEDIAKLRNLKVLDLRWNTIWGTIPESVGELAHIENLLLSGNELTGDIPRSLGSMLALKRLDLSHNRLSGPIPETLGQSRSLQSLGLHHNQLTGPMPSELSQIGTLQRLIANGNLLAGPVPHELHEMPALTHLRIAESDRRAVAPGVAPPVGVSGQLSGLALLDETTMIIDEEAQGTMEQVLAAIVVRNGELHLHTETFPLPSEAEKLNDALDEINERLRESGRRIDSVSDLDRALELYDDASINLKFPEAPSRYVFNAEAGQPKTVHGTRLSSLPQSGASAIYDSVNCPTLKADHPHISHTPSSSDKIIGKAGGRCIYRGSPQIVSYMAHAYLQRWQAWWMFGYWQRVGTIGTSRKTGNSVQFQRNKLVAATACRSGLYRTRLALYITGSRGGSATPFFPFPGLYKSVPQTICC